MTTAERNALVKIIKSRFEILQEQLFARRQQIESLIRERLEAESETARKEMAAQVQDLAKDVEAIRKRSNKIREAGRKKGLELSNRYGDPVPMVQSDVYGTQPGEWRIAKLERRIRNEVAKLTAEADIGRLALREQEQKLLERVFVDTLESGEAEAIFTDIPEVDTLLPLPTEQELKALTA